MYSFYWLCPDFRWAHDFYRHFKRVSHGFEIPNGLSFEWKRGIPNALSKRPRPLNDKRQLINAFRFFPPRRTPRHILELRPPAPKNNDKRQLINAFRFFPSRRTPRTSGSCDRTLREITINAGKLMRAANACRICPPRRTPRTSWSCVRPLRKTTINAS